MPGNPLSAIILLFCSMNFRRSLFSSSDAGIIEIEWSAIANRSGRVSLHSRNRSATVGIYRSRSIHAWMAIYNSSGGIFPSFSAYKIIVSSGNSARGYAAVSIIKFFWMGVSSPRPASRNVNDVSGPLSNAGLAFLTGSNGLILPSALIKPRCRVWCILAGIKLA